MSWSLSMSDVYRTGGATPLEFFFAMAYPLLDWMLVTVAAIVLVNARSRSRFVVTLITLGLMSMAANSTGFAYLSSLLGYSSSDVINVGWVAGHLLLTVAAAYGREAPREEDSAVEMPGWASVWLPFAPLMAAAGVLVYGRSDITTTLLVEGIALVLVVAVLARQFVAVRESRQITEDFMVEDLDRTRRILRGLRARGVRVAIDDFGTGYSALQYLRDLPVDEVKLAGALIAPLPDDPSAAVVARAVIDLARALGIVSVAEGVETADAAEWLRNNGCDTAQGYYFSPPLTAGEVLTAARTLTGSRPQA